MRFSLDHNWQARFGPIHFKGSTVEPDSIHVYQPSLDMPRPSKTAGGTRGQQYNLVLRSQQLKIQQPRDRRFTHSIDAKPSLLLAQSTQKRTNQDPQETMASQEEAAVSPLGAGSNNLPPSS